MGRVRAAMALVLATVACTGSTAPEPTEPTEAPSTSAASAESTSAAAAESITSTTEPIDPALLVELPVDPDVTIGTLPNGLTYYVRFNDAPGGRAELRLAVDAGSVLEDDDQAGSAHFLEHMMFNGTEKYPENELIRVLEGFGPQFGPDINAYTSFDETVYELSVPTDDPSIFEEALDVLRQWASHATLTQADVEAERGVVVEEWRLRDIGLNGRIGNAFGELVLTDTPYENHLPIGTFDSINTMEPEPLRRFYEQWYRPDLMAIVVVGDIHVGRVESMIQDVFGDLEGPSDPQPRPETSVDAPTVAQAGTLADPEATMPSLDVFYMTPSSDRTPIVGSVQNSTALFIAMEIMRRRLSDDVLRGVVPFFEASTFEFEYSRKIMAHGFSVSSAAVDLDSSLDALLAEIQRARQHGFTDAEFEQASDAWQALADQIVEGQDSRQDSEFADAFVEHFLSDAPIMNSDQFDGINDEIMGRLTKADIEEAFATLVTESAARVFVVGPDEPVAAVPTEADILAMIDAAAGRTLEPRPEEEEAPSVLMQRPAEVTPIAFNENPTFGYLEMDYANGARVLFWPTTIADNLVSFGSSSFGGLSQVAVEDLVEAEYGILAIAESGLGGYDQVTVNRVIADKIVGLTPWIDATHEGMTGSAAREDLEYLFQLIHLSHAQPQIDDAAVTRVLSEERPRIESPEDDPRLMALIALLELYYGAEDNRHWAIPPLDEFNAFDTDRALEVYEDRFSNAGEFLFVFVGDADILDVIELSNAYIGTLEGTFSREGFIDHQPLPTGEQIRTVMAGQDDQGLIQFQFTNNLTGQDARSQVVGDLLSLILNNRLRDRIRERLSASYSPFGVVDLQLEPDPYIETYVSVSGDPDRLDEIASEVLDDVRDLRTNGPTPEQLAIAQEQLFREYELVNNPFLLEQVIFFEEHAGREVIELTDRYDIVYTISASEVEAMARIAFPIGSYIEVKLIPAE